MQVKTRKIVACGQGALDAVGHPQVEVLVRLIPCRLGRHPPVGCSNDKDWAYPLTARLAAPLQATGMAADTYGSERCACRDAVQVLQKVPAPQGLGDAPDMGVDGELLAPQAEHQHAGDGLLADALVARQLRLDGLILQLPATQVYGIIGMGF